MPSSGLDSGRHIVQSPILQDKGTTVHLPLAIGDGQLAGADVFPESCARAIGHNVCDKPAQLKFIGNWQFLANARCRRLLTAPVLDMDVKRQCDAELALEAEALSSRQRWHEVVLFAKLELLRLHL